MPFFDTAVSAQESGVPVGDADENGGTTMQTEGAS
jgi:hypothetical protein